MSFPSRSWLLLVHQVPPKPDYLRVKVRRRLQDVGCLPLKNTVYALPDNESAREDFEWIAREIRQMGGEAMICTAHLIEGTTDADLEGAFRKARSDEFAAVAEEARDALRAIKKSSTAANSLAGVHATLARLRRRVEEIREIDHFDSDGRLGALSALAELERELVPPPKEEPVKHTKALERLTGRTWVTRKGIRVDRMASAWLVTRHIDPTARFKFVQEGRYRPRRGEVRFDMFEGEFTHEGDRCTFEVLLDRFGLNDPKLRILAEVIHDLDLKDSKFGRVETPGIGQVLVGIAAAHERDEDRLERACTFLDDLVSGLTSPPRARSGPRRRKA